MTKVTDLLNDDTTDQFHCIGVRNAINLLCLMTFIGTLIDTYSPCIKLVCVIYA